MYSNKNIKNLFLSIFFLILFFNGTLFSVEWEEFTWKKVTFIPQEYGNSYWLEFYFLPNNPKYGFACGYDGVFAKTSDSGKTWYASKIVPHFHAESVSFADTNIGYVSGSRAIYKTIDGGNTWNILDVKGLMYNSWGHCIVGANNVWVVEGHCMETTSPMCIYKSTDGGNTWLKSSKTIYNTSLSDITMFSKDGLGYAISSGYLWQTKDGGITWNVIKETPFVYWKTAMPTFSNWHEDLAIYKNSILIPMSPGCSGGAGNNEGGLAFSRDMGNTWTTFKTDGDMFGTFLLNDSTGWGCGYNNEIYYTRNYGKNWIQMKCGIPLNTHLDDIWFVNDTTAFVSGAGQGGIFRLVRRDTSIAIIGDSMKCKNDMIKLTTDKDFDFYQWLQLEEDGNTIVVGKDKILETQNTGKFILRANNINCVPVQSKPFTVKIFDNTKIIIKSNASFYCIGDTATVWIENNQAITTHKWLIHTSSTKIDTTSEDTIRISQKEFGTYYVYLAYLDSNGCYDTLKYAIDFNNKIKPILEANGSLRFCKDETRIIRLVNANVFTENIWYKDNVEIAKNVSEIVISSAGKYHVTASINKRCENNSDTVETFMRDEIDLLDISENTTPLFIDSVHYGKEGYNYLKIINRGNKSLNITNIFFSKKFAFTVPLSQLPMTINPNETKYIVIYYVPTNIGPESDTLFLQDNCTMRKIVLNGVGKKNYDSAIANCDVKIKIETRSIDIKKILTVENPLPNPVNTLGKIAYTIITELIDNTNNTDFRKDELQNNFVFQIYDALGNVVGTKFQKNILNTINSTKSNIEVGEIIFDLQRLNNGIYFIRLIFSNENIMLPIIKAN